MHRFERARQELVVEREEHGVFDQGAFPEDDEAGVVEFFRVFLEVTGRIPKRELVFVRPACVGVFFEDVGFGSLAGGWREGKDCFEVVEPVAGGWCLLIGGEQVGEGWGFS